MKAPVISHNGDMAAALLSIGLAALTIPLMQIWSMLRPAEAGALLLKWGSWIPYWWTLGEYAGKETVFVVVWLVSWLILHYCLNRRQLRLDRWIWAMLIGYGLVYLLLWPPVYHALVSWQPVPEG